MSEIAREQRMGRPLLSSKPALAEGTMPVSPWFLLLTPLSRRKAMPQFRKRIAVLAAFTLLVPSFTAGHTLAAQPEQAAPQGEDPPGADDAAPTPPPVEHNGVITPPPTGDEGIHTEAPAPDAGNDEEVIPPPGTPGGEPGAVPR
jgi:hypothetical protein